MSSVEITKLLSLAGGLPGGGSSTVQELVSPSNPSASRTPAIVATRVSSTNTPMPLLPPTTVLAT